MATSRSSSASVRNCEPLRTCPDIRICCWPYPIELLADDDEDWMYFKDNILGECADDDLPEE